MSTLKEYKHLVQQALHHDRLYYIEAKPEISDYEYDQLIKRIEAIEEEHPRWVLQDSPTQRVTGDASQKSMFDQVEHTSAMLSLMNTYSEKELSEFLARIEKFLEKAGAGFTTELKIDGVAISLRYEKGHLVRAVTRGDGRKGEDVTENIRTITALPHSINGEDIPDLLEFRGEVYLPLARFQQLNLAKEEAGDEVYANPRNAAAGSLKLLDSKQAAKRGLAIFIYDVAIGPEELTHQSQIPAYLKKLKLPCFNESFFRVCHSVQEILEYAHEMEQKRRSLPFEIDGIVVKLDQLKARHAIGMTGKSPRWAVAYKFAPEQSTTVIEKITVQVGRTGVLTPVAELTPVKLAGSIISRATLHNQDEIDRKDIRIGDTVIIEKGGDVIPKVVSVDLTKRKKGVDRWQMPKNCPSCKNEVFQENGHVAIRCINPNCPSKHLRRIIFFAAKDAMDIDHMGEKVIEKLADAHLVSTFSDIYRLHRDDLEQIEGFKEKSIENLLKSIELSKQTTLDRFIFALGIPHVGKQTAELIADLAKDVDHFIHLTREKLLKIDGVGPAASDAVISFLKEEQNLKEIEQLLNLGVTPQGPKQKSLSHLFNGKIFVLTGTLECHTRSEAGALIKERGGKVSASVSAQTDYLLSGESPGSKYDKAVKLGIKILTEKEFIALLG